MSSRINIVHNDLIRPHEQISPEHVQELLYQIQHDGFIRSPLIVDENSMILLDGHHRFNALKILELSSAPCLFVDYGSDEITVTAWREGEIVTKETVLEAGLSGSLLHIKTSRHHVPDKPEDIMIPLELLK